MEPLTALRIFADHYTFAVHDSEFEPCPQSFLDQDFHPQPGVLGSFSVGYITDGHSILFGTCAHLNSHWIELFFSEQVPDLDGAQRVIVLPLAVSSGEVLVSSLEVDATIALAPGQYTAYFLGFSLGRDQSSEPPWPQEIVEFTDAEYAARTDFEHYKIVFVPGDTTNGRVGVALGAADIAGAREAA